MGDLTRLPPLRLDGADAADRTNRMLELQRLLFRVSRDIGPALELQPVLERAVAAMRELIDFKGGSICLVEGDAIRLVAATPAVSEDVLRLRLPVGEGLSGHVVQSGEPLYSPDLLEDPRVVREIHQTGTNALIRSWIGVPLVVLGKVTGLLQVDSAEPHAFDETDLDVLEGLGVLVAGAIESARRYEAVLELEQMKSDFIERVSHELRTPIAIMNGFASTLQEHGRNLPEEERAAFIDRITQASGRLTYLVEEILTLTTVDAGLGRPVPVEVRVADLVAEVLASVAPADAFDLRISADLTVTSDPAILAKTLEALLDNAAKYAGSGRVSADRSGGHIVVAIDDDGPGIPPSLRPRIFERFVRGRHTVAGMGLGLPIARHLATAIDARIDYEPLESGSRFTLEVPDLPSP